MAKKDKAPVPASEAAIEAAIQEKGLTAPRITPHDIDAAIRCEYYLNAYEALEALEVPAVDGLKVMTICFMVLENGFIVTGESACASPENYDASIGQKIARENARNKIWQLEGYRLRSELAKG